MMSISVKVMVQKVQNNLGFLYLLPQPRGLRCEHQSYIYRTVRTTEEYCVRVVHPVVFM